MIPYVVDADISHVPFIAEKMRWADQREVWASSKKRPYPVLLLSYKVSKYRKTIMLGDEPIGMFGVSSFGLLSNRGVPWFLGTDKIEDISYRFLRGCSKYIGEMSDGYAILENWVDTRNSVSIEWLKWLGFNVEQAAPHGAFGLPFHRFYKEFEYV
jgi:hypothetical protein